MSRRQQTRERILNAARELFRRQGYEQTTTRQIAILAEVAVGSVFSHFPSKFELLYHGMMPDIEDALARAGASDEYDAPKLKLRHYAMHLYDFFLQERELSRLLWREWLWQSAAFSAHKKDFKDRLCVAVPDYDPLRVDTLFDVYVMTLIHGLNDDKVQARELVRELSNKLALI